MHAISNIELTLATLVLEAGIGYPDFIYRVVGHPVTWIGSMLSNLEARLNHSADSDRSKRLRGSLTLAVVLAASMGTAFLIGWISPKDPVRAGMIVLISTSLMAQRSLCEHVQAVADALQIEGLEAARIAVSMIVGRNPASLDESGVARAAIESLAENYSDGVVAPAFWLAVGGLVGAVGYKATNTADSMIGHRTPRYAAFGWAAARLDDLINLPASRLAALFLMIGACAVGGSPSAAFRAIRKDARHHRSPNAGWPEAAMAGALGLQLAGPRVYGDTVVDDAFMGDGRRDASASDIRRALKLYKAACVAQVLLLLAIVFIGRY
jgi:adenosylcobinamide-phosphate synthase